MNPFRNLAAAGALLAFTSAAPAQELNYTPIPSEKGAQSLIPGNNGKDVLRDKKTGDLLQEFFGRKENLCPMPMKPDRKQQSEPAPAPMC